MIIQKIKSMKITTIADNLVQTTGTLAGQWGLSFYLEVEDFDGRFHGIVFDTGSMKEGVLLNLKTLNIDLSNIEYLVLSHGHWDHNTTTVDMLKLAGGGVKVVAHPHAFFPKFVVRDDGTRRDLGVPEGQHIEDIEEAGGKMILRAKPFELLPGISTTGQISRITDFEKTPNSGRRRPMLTVIDDQIITDQIFDDQALFINVEDLGYVVITGCCHSGIMNTILHIQEITKLKEIYGIVGGLHLFREKNNYVSQLIEGLKKFNLRLISPCHCTGFNATCKINQAFPNSFILNFSGRIIEVGTKPLP